MTATVTVKRCPTCKEHKPAWEFHRNRTRRDGLQATCKECHARQQEIRGPRIRSYHRKRAMQQAVTQLVANHRDEYDALYRAALNA